MLNLYLLRHGKAANPDNYDNDFDRPLNKKGIVQVNQVGYLLKQGNCEIGQVLSSSASRTKETALIANHYLGIRDITFHEEIYLARQEVIMEVIGEKATSENLLYVGHNFGISDIASYLSGEHLIMSTGMLVHIRFDLDNWQQLSQNTGKLVFTHAPDIFIP